MSWLAAKSPDIHKGGEGVPLFSVARASATGVQLTSNLTEFK